MLGGKKQKWLCLNTHFYMVNINIVIVTVQLILSIGAEHLSCLSWTVYTALHKYSAHLNFYAFYHITTTNSNVFYWGFEMINTK